MDVVAFRVVSSASDSLSVKKARKRAMVPKTRCQPEEAVKDATVTMSHSDAAAAPDLCISKLTSWGPGILRWQPGATVAKTRSRRLEFPHAQASPHSHEFAYIEEAKFHAVMTLGGEITSNGRE